MMSGFIIHNTDENVKGNNEEQKLISSGMNAN